MPSNVTATMITIFYGAAIRPGIDGRGTAVVPKYYGLDVKKPIVPGFLPGLKIGIKSESREQLRFKLA